MTMPRTRRPAPLRRTWMFVPGLDAAAQAAGLAGGAQAGAPYFREATISKERRRSAML